MYWISAEAHSSPNFHHSSSRVERDGEGTTLLSRVFSFQVGGGGSMELGVHSFQSLWFYLCKLFTYAAVVSRPEIAPITHQDEDGSVPGGSTTITSSRGAALLQETTALSVIAALTGGLGIHF